MKNLIGLVVILILGAIAYYALNKDELGQTNKEEFRDFAIEDTAAINKIFISQPNGKKVLLSRNEERQWIVNNDFPARRDGIQLILKTLHDIQVQAPVSESTFEYVVKRLATGSTKIEYYEGDNELVKTWYVGDVTPSKVGTYMLLEKNGQKSSKPFITHMIMERGYLGTRYFLDLDLWKEPVVMEVNPQSIKSIEVTHYSDTTPDFKIEQYAMSKFKLTNLDQDSTLEINPDDAIIYFKKFKQVYYEYLDRKTDQEEIDSIYNATPRNKIVVTTDTDEKFTLTTHFMPVAPNSELLGKPITYHPERMYVRTSYLGKSLHPIVQNLTFDPLVAEISDFKPLTTVEK